MFIDNRVGVKSRFFDSTSSNTVIQLLPNLARASPARNVRSDTIKTGEQVASIISHSQQRLMDGALKSGRNDDFGEAADYAVLCRNLIANACPLIERDKRRRCWPVWMDGEDRLLSRYATIDCRRN